MQIQGQLWVTGRKWVDFMSYHPDAPEQILERVEPDPAVQQAFDDVIPAFVAELAEARAEPSRPGLEVVEGPA